MDQTLWMMLLSFTRGLTRIRTMSSSAAYSELWLSGPKATQFYTRTYTPNSTPRAALVFIHGFAEHVGRYAHFHPLLSQREIAVFAFDQRGFGKTALDTEGNKSKDSAYGKTSWSEQMMDISWAIEHAKKTFSGVPTFLMGHSMVRSAPTAPVTREVIRDHRYREVPKRLVLP